MSSRWDRTSVMPSEWDRRSSMPFKDTWYPKKTKRRTKEMPGCLLNGIEDSWFSLNWTDAINAFRKGNVGRPTVLWSADESKRTVYLLNIKMQDRLYNQLCLECRSCFIYGSPSMDINTLDIISVYNTSWDTEAKHITLSKANPVSMATVIPTPWYNLHPETSALGGCTHTHTRTYLFPA